MSRNRMQCEPRWKRSTIPAALMIVDALGRVASQGASGWSWIAVCNTPLPPKATRMVIYPAEFAICKTHVRSEGSKTTILGFILSVISDIIHLILVLRCFRYEWLMDFHERVADVENCFGLLFIAWLLQRNYYPLKKYILNDVHRNIFLKLVENRWKKMFK